MRKDSATGSIPFQPGRPNERFFRVARDPPGAAALTFPRIGPGDRTLPGSIAIGAGEASWSFVPETPWIAGLHHLLIDPVLEDLAGNSVVRVFDRELGRPEHRPRSPDTVSVPFVVVST